MKFKLILFALFLLLNTGLKAQEIKLNFENAPLKTILKEISRQSGYNFVYTEALVNSVEKVSISYKSSVKNINLLLDKLFFNTSIEYTVKGKQIALTFKVSVKAPQSGNQNAISGKITDKSGSPLVGITVSAKGSSKGTMTDTNGYYYIQIGNDESVLAFSCIGMKKQEIEVKGRAVISVIMEEETSRLEEVVVIGYGSSSRKGLTASVSSVTSEDISKQPVTNPLAALQGRISGADIVQSNGLPGSRVSIMIRGQNSLSNGTTPLYIIDGVPFNIIDGSVPATNDLNSFGIFAANRGISPFSMINPSDIDRIDVLKDADATAIYGTKGANGVVLITTKKGLAGRTKLDISFNQGVGTVGHFMDMMNLKQYLSLRREALRNDGKIPDASNAPDLVTWDTTKTTNWQKKYMGGTAKATDLQATVSGGDARTRFLLGAAYHKETTVYPGDFGNDRLSFRFNAEHNSLNKKFFAQISTTYAFDITNLISTDLSSTYNLPPNLPLYKADGSLYWDNNFTNPESYLLQKYIGKTNNLSSNILFRYTIIPGLDLKTSIGYNNVSTDQNLQTPILSQRPTTSPTNNARFALMNQQSYIIEPQAVYTISINKGILTALLGGTWQQALNKTQALNANNYSNPDLLGTLTGAATYTLNSSTNTLYKYNSIFGRLTFNWDNKYIINGNIRKDGSSRFGPGKQWGTFGSIGGAWVFSEEKFIADALPFLSFGKLRASYGVTGNDQLQDYQFLATLSSYSGTYLYQGMSILAPSRIANPTIQWETNRQLEVALDLSFLKERLMLTINAYRKRSDNQLSYITLAYQSGTNSYTGNMPALLQNQGLEFELNTKNIVSKNFTWTSSFNISLPENKLLSIDPSYFYASTTTLGKSLSQVKRYVYLGVDATGTPIYLNQTTGASVGGSTLNYTTDRVLIGDTDPKFYGGLSNVLTYKAFELSFFFQFKKINGSIYPSSVPGVLTNGNQLTYWNDRWQTGQGAGGNTTLPKSTTTSSVYSNYSGSTATWGDNSFLKLKNVTLTYLLPSKFIQKANISNVKVYLQGQNLLTWTKNIYSYDPETGTSMPALRMITFGVNCSF